MEGEEATMSPDGSSALRIGFAQTRPALGDVAGNLERAAQLVAGAPPFDVLVLPELFSTGYLLDGREEVARLSEEAADAGAPTLAFLRRVAKAREAWVAGGFAERDGGRLYNAAALAGRDGSLRVYRKVHLFDGETERFDPGDRPFRAWPLPREGGPVTVGMMVCFDWLYPESARCLAVDGAEVLLHPSNLVLPYCQDAMRTRCLENRVYAVTANRCGTETLGGETLAFTGASQITGPRGEVLARAPADGEHVAVVEIDLEHARDKQVTRRNHLMAGRRPAAYDRLGASDPGA
jgi:predicted amidohydrolase